MYAIRSYYAQRVGGTPSLAVVTKMFHTLLKKSEEPLPKSGTAFGATERIHFKADRDTKPLKQHRAHGHDLGINPWIVGAQRLDIQLMELPERNNFV